MTGEIVNAIVQEILAMPDFTDGGGEGSVMKRTDFKLNDIGSYGMPFVLADIMEGEDSDQMLGGVKRMAWKFGLSSYNYQPDTTGDDKTGYTPNLMNVIDRIVDHFNAGARRSFIFSGALTVGRVYTVIGATGDTVTYNSIIYNVGDYFTVIAGQTAFTATGTGYLMYFGWLTAGMTQILNDYGFRWTFGGLGPADPLDGDGLIMGYKIIGDSVSFDTSTANVTQSSSVVTATQQINNPPY